jgi:hypothetical protein
MHEQPLCREAEIRAPRGTGVAVIMVAMMAMFTLVATSALAVRVRLGYRRAPAAFEGYGAAAMFSADGRVTARSAWVEMQLVDEFYDALVRLDREAALRTYDAFPLGSRARWALAEKRDRVAEEYQLEQLLYLDEEVARKDCAAVRERLMRMRATLPDEPLPLDMAACRELDLVY